MELTAEFFDRLPDDFEPVLRIGNETRPGLLGVRNLVAKIRHDVPP
jgi:hypothetical protein